MKIRTDFVSNSSSSSFVVATKKGYSLFDFAKDLAAESVDSSSKHHDPNLQKTNETNLAYCLNNYELLFLGSLKVRTQETVIAKSELPKTLESGYVYTETDWEDELSYVKKWNEIKNNPKHEDYAWMKRECSRDYLDEKTQTLHTFYDYWESGIAMDTFDDFEIRRSPWFEEEIASGNASPEQVKHYEEEKLKRVKRIEKICLDHSEGKLEHVPCSYQITLDTIKNTRDMLEAGLELSFSGFEDLDAIEKRLKEGQHLFAIRMNNSGDGYLKDGIYLEEDSKLRKWDYKTEFEILDCENG